MRAKWQHRTLAGQRATRKTARLAIRDFLWTESYGKKGGRIYLWKSR